MATPIYSGHAHGSPSNFEKQPHSVGHEGSRGSAIYVAEASMNRVLRLLRRADGAYVTTVFVQLAGGTGPTALALDDAGRLYVCCSEMAAAEGSQVRNPLCV